MLEGVVHGVSMCSGEKLKPVVKSDSLQSLASETGCLIKTSFKRKTAVCPPTHWFEQDVQTFCYFLD